MCVVLLIHVFRLANVRSIFSFSNSPKLSGRLFNMAGNVIFRHLIASAFLHSCSTRVLPPAFSQSSDCRCFDCLLRHHSCFFQCALQFCVPSLVFGCSVSLVSNRLQPPVHLLLHSWRLAAFGVLDRAPSVAITLVLMPALTRGTKFPEYLDARSCGRKSLQWAILFKKFLSG